MITRDTIPILYTEKGFGDVWEEMHGKLCYYAYRLGIDHESANDIVIEVFGRFWERKSPFQSISELRGTLYKSVHNAVINSMKKTTRRNKRHIQYSNIHDQSQLPKEAYIIEAEILKEAFQCFQLLPPKYKKIIDLIREGKSIPEIAILTGETENVISQHKKRAITKMIEIFKKTNKL